MLPEENFMLLVIYWQPANRSLKGIADTVPEPPEEPKHSQRAVLKDDVAKLCSLYGKIIPYHL